MAGEKAVSSPGQPAHHRDGLVAAAVRLWRGFQVARRAFAWHESQTKDDRWQVAYKGSRFDSTLYTLVFSTVGEDEAGNDFFEHIEK